MNVYYMLGVICIVDRVWIYGKLFDMNEGYLVMIYLIEE